MYVDNLTETLDTKKQGYNSTTGLHMTSDTTGVLNSGANPYNNLSNSRSLKDKIHYLSSIHRKIDTELSDLNNMKKQIQNAPDQER